MNPNHKTKSLAFTNVHIADRFWKPRLEANRKVTLPIEYRICKQTGRIDAWTWKPGRPCQPHIFWDSDVAKWMEAAAYSLAVHPDRSLEKKLDAVVAMMAKAQLPDGYLNSHFIHVEPDKRWTNLRDCHELYCAGHLIEAAVAYFQATGKRRFLDIICRYADHIEATFGREPGKKRGYCGHEEIELALIKLYQTTRNLCYLKLSKYFVDERGSQPHYFDQEARARGESAPQQKPNYNYCQAHSPVRKQTTAEGHAVRAMYLYSGMADVAAESGDASLLKACRRLWQNVVERRMYVTGGVGSMAKGERFSFDYDLPNEEAYTETCAAIGLVFWARRMLNLEPDRRYADVMERALYNGVLSGISLDGKHFFYCNPLAVYPAEYHFARRTGQSHKHMIPARQRWFGCACCPPNVARLLASFGEYLYSINDHEVYVHLFAQSRANITLAGQHLTLAQKTDYPWDGRIKIIIQLPANSSVAENKKINFTLALRIPAWCRNYRLRVNGKAIKIPVPSRGYIKLARNWQWGDEIELILPMPVEEIEAHPGVRHDCGRVALQRGPLVYCLEEADNGPNLNDIALAKNPHWILAGGPAAFGDIPVILGQAVRRSRKTWKNRLYQPAQALYEKTTIQAVPYCLWNNRGEGEMLVWIRKSG